MISQMQSVDLEVFNRYAGLSLPRHVSYPMPNAWHDMTPEQVAGVRADSLDREPANALSLYLHIPFCETLCKFCACNRVIQRKDADGAADTTDRYIDALEREIRELARTAGDRPVRQIHWGGGSPTYLPPEQVERIQAAIAEVFRIADDAEVSMELDPRHVTQPFVDGLKRAGFNRMSMGIQDFDQRVQEHVRRIQPYEMVRDAVALCRDAGFISVNFDLIYGMPFQTPETIRETVEQSLTLSPDRVAYYHYAQIPEKIATQRGMDNTRLPDSETKLDMFLIGIELFEAAGYDFIGLDHFAKSDELLAQSLEEGTLQRNFQGMTTGGGLDMIGLGVSSIGQYLGVGFVQNVKSVDEYVERIQRGECAVERGKRMTSDDCIRQAVIGQLYCETVLRPEPIEREFGIDFAKYFSRELGIMAELERDGLVTIDREGAVHVSKPLGRVLLRNVAAVFDAYLNPEAYRIGETRCYSANA